MILSSTIFAVFYLCTSTLRAEDDGGRSLHESRLLDFLFNKVGYSPLIRPVLRDDAQIRVNFSLALSQLINTDEKNQIMKVNVWLQLYWYDYQMVWNPRDFGNIRNINIPCDQVWIPDIVLFNNADGNYEVTYKVNVVIYYNGAVIWIPPAIFKSSCQIDVTSFPFDEQFCEMRFASWTYPGNELQLGWRHGTHDNVDLDDYLYSGTWDIIECPGYIAPANLAMNNAKNKNFVVYRLRLRRKTLFYMVNLIIPCILISLLTVVVFALPADAGEKITLCISILVTLVVFMLLVSKILPPSITVPLVSKYMLFTFLMNVLAIFITVVVINSNYRSSKTHRMPDCVRLLFLVVLPRILCMKRPQHSRRRLTTFPDENLAAEVRSSESVHELCVEVMRGPDILELNGISNHVCLINDSKIAPAINEDENKRLTSILLTPDILRAAESVRFLTQRLKTDDLYEWVREDWKYLAMVADRLLLAVFVIVTVAVTCLIFLNAPHMFEYVDQRRIIANIMGIPR